MKVKISQATRMITIAIKAGLVPFLVGSPGCGKSQVAYQIAKTWGLKLIDLRLGQCDPTDLLGFPHIFGNKGHYVPMDTFPVEGDEIPEGFNGWLLFMDEFNSASTAVQAAAYKIILDRMVGQKKLHKNVAMMCAGNLETDNAIVNPMSTALQSRLIHLELLVDVNEFLDHSSEMKFDHRIHAYIKSFPKSLYTFKPDHTDNTYACPRTWEFGHKLLQHVETDHPDALPLLAGAVSEGEARQFLAYTKVFKNIPTPEEIELDPKNTRIPQEDSILYALTGSIGHNASKKNITPFMTYVERIPMDFQIVCLRDIVRRNKPLLAHPSVTGWVEKTTANLF